MMSKGQLGQIFVYVATIVVISFLLFYGYKAIFTFQEKADQVSFVQFKNSLQNSVKSLSVDFGSVRVREFTLPQSVSEVCLVKSHPEMPDQISGTGNPLMEDSVNSGVGKNVFLFGEGLQESFKIEKIKVFESSEEEDFLCVEVVSGKIEVRMEGVGDHVKISEA